MFFLWGVNGSPVEYHCITGNLSNVVQSFSTCPISLVNARNVSNNPRKDISIILTKSIKKPNEAKLWVFSRIPTQIVRYILVRSRNPISRIETNNHHMPLSSGLLRVTNLHKRLTICANSPAKAFVWRNSFLDINNRTVRCVSSISVSVRFFLDGTT